LGRGEDIEKKSQHTGECRPSTLPHFDPHFVAKRSNRLSLVRFIMYPENLFGAKNSVCLSTARMAAPEIVR
jgi:hypothetical protein